MEKHFVVGTHHQSVMGKFKANHFYKVTLRNPNGDLFSYEYKNKTESLFLRTIGMSAVHSNNNIPMYYLVSDKGRYIGATIYEEAALKEQERLSEILQKQLD